MNTSPSLRIPTRTLLWVYIIIPLGALLMFVDLFWWGGYLRDHTPWTPDTFFWYAILFPYPHILVSFVSFADKEYVAYYRKKFLIGIPVILLVSLFLPQLSIPLTVVTLSLATIVHVALQQAGIALMLMRAKRGVLTWLWRWAITISSTLIFFMVVPVSLPTFLSHELLWQVSLSLLIVVAVTSLLLLWEGRTRSTEERWYFIGTAMLPVIAFIALNANYLFVAIIVSRLAHDVTAFLFYYTHDYYRNLHTNNNFVAKVLSMPVRTYLVSITLFAIVLSYTIYAKNFWGIGMIYFISMAHYYVESFMWKSGTPHRAVMIA